MGAIVAVVSPIAFLYAIKFGPEPGLVGGGTLLIIASIGNSFERGRKRWSLIRRIYIFLSGTFSMMTILFPKHLPDLATLGGVMLFLSIAAKT
jgi:hypothetical protein